MLRAILLLLAVISCLLALGTTSRIADANAAQRIVGGSIAHIFKYPFEVSVRRKSCNVCAFESYCAGIIISSSKILTAASCVRNAEIAHTHVVAGSTYRSNAAHDGLVYPIDSIVEFNANTEVDVVILNLALPLDTAQLSIAIANLAKTQPAAGSLASTAGWGQIEEAGAYNELLTEVHVPIVDIEQCRRDYFWTSITDFELCAGYAQGGADACMGDAGSPLLLNNEVVGVVSWGYGCARANNPGVYTSVAKIYDWIQSNL